METAQWRARVVSIFIAIPLFISVPPSGCRQVIHSDSEDPRPFKTGHLVPFFFLCPAFNCELSVRAIRTSSDVPQNIFRSPRIWSDKRKGCSRESSQCPGSQHNTV